MVMITTMDADLEYFENLHTGFRSSPPIEINDELSPEERGLLFYIGTGGDGEQPFFSPASGGYEFNTSRTSYDEFVDLNSTISLICDAFGLSKKQMAQICSTTRKTIYNWMDSKSNPRDKTIVKLYALHRAAQDWLQSGGKKPGKRLYEIIIGEKSLYDLLLDEKIDLDAISFARKRLLLTSTANTKLDSLFFSS